MKLAFNLGSAVDPSNRLRLAHAISLKPSSVWIRELNPQTFIV